MIIPTISKSTIPRLQNLPFQDSKIQKPNFHHQKRNHTSLHSSSSFDQNLLPHLDFAIFTAPSHLFQWRRLMKTFSPFPENNFQLSPSCNSTERIHQIDDSIDIGRN